MNATQERPVRQRKPRKPQARSILLLTPPNKHGRNGIVRITAGKQVQHYFLDRVPSDWGEGFALTKAAAHLGDDTAIYHVHLTDEGPTCDCPGYLRWSHCK